MSDMVHKFSSVMETLEKAIYYILGIFFAILGWYFRKFNDMEKRMSNMRKEFDEKYLTKEVFEEFRRGLYQKLDDIKESIDDLKEEIRKK